MSKIHNKRTKRHHQRSNKSKTRSRTQRGGGIFDFIYGSNENQGQSQVYASGAENQGWWDWLKQPFVKEEQTGYGNESNSLTNTINETVNTVDTKIGEVATEVKDKAVELTNKVTDAVTGNNTSDTTAYSTPTTTYGGKTRKHKHAHKHMCSKHHKHTASCCRRCKK
jgi:hypothetical protein